MQTSKLRKATLKRAVSWSLITTSSYNLHSEIQALMESMKLTMENASIGKPVDSTTTVPEFLTPEKTLSLMEKIMIETVKLIKNQISKIKNTGETLSLENPKVLQALQNVKIEDLRLEHLFRKKILSESGLDNFEDPPAKIFQFATQKFSRELPDFKEKMLQLDIKHKGAFEKIINDPSFSDEEIERTISLQNSKASLKMSSEVKKIESEPLITDAEIIEPKHQPDALESMIEQPLIESADKEVIINEEPKENTHEEVEIKEESIQ